jgi:hypothetical protein
LQPFDSRKKEEGLPVGGQEGLVKRACTRKLNWVGWSVFTALLQHLVALLHVLLCCLLLGAGGGLARQTPELPAAVDS